MLTAQVAVESAGTYVDKWGKDESVPDMTQVRHDSLMCVVCSSRLASACQ